MWSISPPSLPVIPSRLRDCLTFHVKSVKASILLLYRRALPFNEKTSFLPTLPRQISCPIRDVNGHLFTIAKTGQLSPLLRLGRLLQGLLPPPQPVFQLMITIRDPPKVLRVTATPIVP